MKNYIDEFRKNPLFEGVDGIDREIGDELQVNFWNFLQPEFTKEGDVRGFHIRTDLT